MVTALSAGLALGLGSSQAGFVALFLVAASLSDRLEQLLDENRDAIWRLGAPPRRANARTAASLWAVWLGILAGCGALAALLGAQSTRGFFGFALDAAGVGEGSLGAGLGSFGGLLLHNLGVLGAVVALALLFRGYGTMLALSWNACVWAFVLGTHFQAGGAASGLNTFAAVSPHLALEGLSYVVGSLAGVFVSQGLVRYELRDPRLRRVLAAAARLAAVALGLLVGAAWLEATWAPVLLGG